MPELRQDPTTKEWVVIATERAKRPDQFRKREESEPLISAPNQICPFCPGNESLTPLEVFALRDSGEKDQPGWRVRVVPNRFAAFVPQEGNQRHNHGRFFRTMDGFGFHEVIIESPDHRQILSLMSKMQLLDIFSAYRQRYDALRKDPRIKLILLFRNQGLRAGSSLLHPHSQLVATPIIPFHIRQKYEVAIQHYDDTGRCLYCDVVAEERAVGKRIVLETTHFVVLHPFASQVPFETWITPTHHNPCAAHVSAEEMEELARVLQHVLRGLYMALHNPDFNLMVHTAPVEDEEKPYFLWHIEIRPRVTTIAGLELATGIYINPALPEETASFLKSALANLTVNV